ncbi:MAG: DUF1987 domain-containing protein [Bacteroidales bacterium]|jgi:hypothetical protein|nr:DUF1987 domain-containing protein [Bacteroidales bacterium]
MSLTIEQKIDTPYVHLEKGLIEISGRLLPENVLVFFNPIDNWILKYLEHPAPFTQINLSLSYINSCSTKHLSDLLKALDDKYQQGFNMKITYSYEEGDESAFEVGQDLESIIQIPFEYILTESNMKSQKRLKVKNLITGKVGEISQKYWEAIKRNGHEKDFELLEKN